MKLSDKETGGKRGNGNGAKVNKSMNQQNTVRIPYCTDIDTGEYYYFLKRRWQWAGEVKYFEYNTAWLKSICTRHGIEYALIENQTAILFAHRYHKFDYFSEYVDFLRTFFPIVYSQEMKLYELKT
jgi:rhamnogalacturonyl hydrolase YesR